MTDHRETTGSTSSLLQSRSAGLLMHVTSLPGPYGIGDLGNTARSWIDLLAEAGQAWWQMLPLGPTGYGDSPYQPVSSFAGNWLLISPDDLVADGLLHSDELTHQDFAVDFVDFPAVRSYKQQLLQTVHASFATRAGSELQQSFSQFCEQEQHWLEEYALFQALQDRYQGASYLTWPKELVRRDVAALSETRQQLSGAIEQIRLAQFLVFRQAEQLKQYSHSQGIRLIGDLPFFVSPDSCDVWANPELFLLDEQFRPEYVAGVPPDYFSAEGQLWGNPVYDWEALQQTGYQWNINRIRALLQHVDLIRLDHFRGFAAAWHIPAGSPNALKGEWVTGPASDFFTAVQQELGDLPFIAEDLGIITADVNELRDQFQLPGTRVLQFAFDGDPRNLYLPHNFVTDTVVYTGTHDNNTTRGWYASLTDQERQIVCRMLHHSAVPEEEMAPLLLQQAWSSIAALAITPLQDLLNLGEDARMNTPGQCEGNWRWRCTQDMLSEPAFQSLRKLTTIVNRLPENKQNES
ncbi:4-alpha-glucanotransferase [Gimesia panareensis]|uniref:4-alpha-glucanotransferase n=1 Tax=Gimesia panareensis TaxID=2527978 RepID=A0A518FVY0_9PLAN|nr:4-alpha-glucanotransferase [Gimesia panareensis]QDV20466.1 4-alpha-glucanotransferase [Gimesia panareensis]